MPVVRNTARDAAGNAIRATVVIRLVAGDVGSVNTPGYSADGTVIDTYTTRTDDDGIWEIDLTPNADYLPTGTYYEVQERPRGSRVAFVSYIEVPDVAGPLDMVGLLVDPVAEPDALYILATQRGAAGGVATLDGTGQVPLSQLGNAPTGGGGGGTAATTVVAETSYGQASTAGVATTYSRGDHTHGTPALPTAAAIGAATSGHTHSGTYDPAGTAAAAVATHSADTTAVHGITDTAALVLTDDSRLTDARTPTAHAASHASAGSDPVTLAQSQITGLTAALASKSDTGHIHAGSDITSGTVAFARLPTGTTSTTVAVGDHTHAGGGGAVDSVNGQTGVVVLGAADVGAQPSDGDLTAIAALAPTNDDVIQRKAGAWTNRTMAQVKTDLALTKSDVGLSNVDNTADTAKPVSTAQQTALNLKANLASPTFTGTPAAPTAAQGTSTTQVATTAYVQTEAGLLVPKSLIDAKGDLLVGTAADTAGRLAVGTDGQVLVADSGETTGLAWETRTQVLVLAAAAAVPGGTPAGTVIVRLAA